MCALWRIKGYTKKADKNCYFCHLFAVSFSQTVDYVSTA